MIAYPWGALYAGIMLCIAAGLTLTRHLLLDPVAPHYPKAPLFVRQTMFAFGAVLMFLGLQFVWVYASGKPNTTPPQPSASMQLLATALVGYKASLLINIVRQRYSVEVWDRLNRINEMLRCSDGRFLSMFSRVK